MDCIVNALRAMERTEISLKLRMTKLGLRLPDEYRWTREVSVAS